MRSFLSHAVVMRRVLALVGFVCIAFAVFFPSSVEARTVQQAYAACSSYATSMDSMPNISWTSRCSLSTQGIYNGYRASGTYQYSGQSVNSFNAFYDFDGPPPANPCTTITPARIYNQGKILEGSSICQRANDPVSGGQVQCAVNFTPIAPPTQNQYSGAWETYGTLAASGNLCSGQQGDPWKDGNGGAMNPAPPVPTLPAVDVPAPPQVCGGGSCYDAKNDKYCATSGGQQFCVAGATARSAAGGCVSSGDATICAGSPNAPSPPAPPASPITNPLTQIKSQDNTTQADKVTGTPQNISTTVYAQPSANVKNGQQAGDRGPAPASSTGSPDVTSSGGGDCHTPPIVTGSPGLAQVAYQAWATRCAIESSNSPGGVVGGLGDLYTPSTDTVSSVVSEFKDGVAASPVSSSVTGFFSVGSVGGACPVWTLPANDYLPAMTFDFYCRPELDYLLDMARFVLLIGCAYAAWRIAMGDA